MELFYTNDINGDCARFSSDEVHHALKVKRHKRGDMIRFVDGVGHFYAGTIAILDRNEMNAEIQEKVDEVLQPYAIEIAIALTKNIKRMEWCFEKLTEIGVTRITPIVTQRSQRQEFNVQRMQKILVSAMKQSLRATLPVLGAMVPIVNWAKSRSDACLPTRQGTLKCIAQLSPRSQPLSQHYSKGNDVIIAIGPEGDFTDEEISMMKAHNFAPVTLGDKRLRTETSGVVAASIILGINQ